MLWRRLKGRRGQSIVEYLVIVTVVIIAIFLVRDTVQTNMQQLFQESANQTGRAAGELGNLQPER